MSNKINIAILGATGTVGQAFLEILEERDFPVDKIYPLASANSAGKEVTFRGESLEVIDAEQFDFSLVHIGLFSAGGEISRKYAPIATQAGCIVIDNTSEFRYEPDIPLVIPEVNPGALLNLKNQYIIANPNCSTIQMLVALKPIYDAVGISRINVCTYQAVSGAGRSALSELVKQTGEMLNGRAAASEVFPVQIAFNAIPQIDQFEENGYTREEMKMVWETQKIFNDNKIKINPTAVRVPVTYGHSEAIHIETKESITAQKARELLDEAIGIELIDDIDNQRYPTALCDATGNDAVYVGRVRKDISTEKGLDLWVVADNVRKGAALNAIQIAELLVSQQDALGIFK